MCGVMYFQTTKKSKWSKRYFEIKLSGLYHYKDTKVKPPPTSQKFIND